MPANSPGCSSTRNLAPYAAAGLLVAEQAQDDVARRGHAFLGRRAAGRQHHGHAALHVQRAAAPDVAVLDQARQKAGGSSPGRRWSPRRRGRTAASAAHGRRPASRAIRLGRAGSLARMVVCDAGARRAGSRRRRCTPPRCPAGWWCQSAAAPAGSARRRWLYSWLAPFVAALRQTAASSSSSSSSPVCWARADCASSARVVKRCKMRNTGRG